MKAGFRFSEWITNGNQSANNANLRENKQQTIIRLETNGRNVIIAT